MESKALPRGREVAALASRQHGVVSVRQLKRLHGYSEGSIAKAVTAGRLHRLYRGVFAVGHTDLSLQGQSLAAVLACGPEALLSHYSAGWLHGLISSSPVPIHVTTPVPRGKRVPIRVHHSRTLADEDRALEEGIPVTSVARTALDLAALLPSRRLGRALKRAEELKCFDLGDFESVLARNRGHRGARRLRRAVAIYEPPRFTRSGVEREFLRLVEGTDLPPPLSAFTVAGYELDVYWPELRFAVEIDTFETHGTHQSFEGDRVRREDLKLAGIEMTQVTDKRLEREPERVLERVARLLAQRREELGLAGSRRSPRSST